MKLLRPLAVLLAASTALTAAACGGGGNGGDAKPAGASTDRAASCGRDAGAVTRDVFARPPAGLRFVALSASARAQVLQAFPAKARERLARVEVQQVTRAGAVVGAALVLVTKEATEAGDLTRGFVEGAKGKGTPVKVGGRDGTQTALPNGLTAILVPRTQCTFIAGFAQRAGVARQVTEALVR